MARELNEAPCQAAACKFCAPGQLKEDTIRLFGEAADGPDPAAAFCLIVPRTPLSKFHCVLYAPPIPQKDPPQHVSAMAALEPAQREVYFALVGYLLSNISDAAREAKKADHRVLWFSQPGYGSVEHAHDQFVLIEEGPLERILAEAGGKDGTPGDFEKHERMSFGRFAEEIYPSIPVDQQGNKCYVMMFAYDGERGLHVPCDTAHWFHTYRGDQDGRDQYLRKKIARATDKDWRLTSTKTEEQKQELTAQTNATRKELARRLTHGLAEIREMFPGTI